MTPAEFKVVREFLGLSGDWLAAHLKVSGRTVRHWEQGKYPIPDGVREEIERLEAETAQFVSRAIDALMDMPDPIVVTYRSDDEYRAAHPEVNFPASWHRAVVARVAQEVLALSITYPEGSTMDPLYTVETDATLGAAETIAGETLGWLPGVSPAGRLGTELTLAESEAKKVGAGLRARGYEVIVSKA